MKTNVKPVVLEKRNIALLFCVALLFFVGHYCVYANHIELSREIRLINDSALLGLCLFGSIFLLADSKRLRSRRIFALQMQLVGLAAAYTMLRIVTHDDVLATPSRLISPGVLIYGNIYAFIVMMYPFELLYPGQMTFGKYFKLFLPALLTGLIYYIYITLTGHRTTEVESWTTLLSNFHRFDVWFRFTIFIYPFWMLILILRQRRRYIVWCRINFSNTGYTDLGWLDYYLFGYFLIAVSYMIVVLTHNPQSTLMHSLCFLLFFGFAFYRILRQEAPASLQFGTRDDRENMLPTDSRESKRPGGGEEIVNDKYRFVDKIPEYKIMLEQWMDAEKPYLNKDFKLLDVMQALPLNRSYLSRMFNEAYGETFFSFVMRYRIEQSCHLLTARPDLTVARIAQICGFSSASVFGRAFLKNVGMTPKEFRDNRSSVT